MWAGRDSILDLVYYRGVAGEDCLTLSHSILRLSTAALDLLECTSLSADTTQHVSSGSILNIEWQQLRVMSSWLILRSHFTRIRPTCCNCCTHQSKGIMQSKHATVSDCLTNKSHCFFTTYSKEKQDHERQCKQKSLFFIFRITILMESRSWCWHKWRRWPAGTSLPSTWLG